MEVLYQLSYPGGGITVARGRGIDTESPCSDGKLGRARAYAQTMELRQTNPRRQGDIGEAAAIQWFTELGATVCFPLFHSPDFDLVADVDGELFRVQVKTSSCEARGNLRGVHSDSRRQPELERPCEAV
jgi:hypothetical protein